MRHQDGLRALLAEEVNRGQALPHSGVVGYHDLAIALLGWDIEIDANQNALPPRIKISDG